MKEAREMNEEKNRKKDVMDFWKRHKQVETENNAIMKQKNKHSMMVRSPWETRVRPCHLTTANNPTWVKADSSLTIWRLWGYRKRPRRDWSQSDRLEQDGKGGVRQIEGPKTKGTRRGSRKNLLSTDESPVKQSTKIISHEMAAEWAAASARWGDPLVPE